MPTLQIKPLTVNQCWKGRRFKTDAYEEYEKKLLWLLPNDYKLPIPPYRISFEFGLSNSQADYDNPVKPLQDVLSKKYGFNDKLIMQGVVTKFVVPKGAEYFTFSIEHYEL